jgi:hypothetical protein
MECANLKNLSSRAAALTFATIALTSASAQTVKPKMATDIPPEITTPDTVETRIGTLKFFDGMPDKDTVEKCYDNLDFQRGVEVFLNTMPGASLYAMREGLRSVGVDNQTVTLFETLMDSKSLFLTPNTETVYLIGWLDLKDGPIVVETPPNILGFVDDFWFRYVIDMGNAGPDKGKGGKFLFLPGEREQRIRRTVSHQKRSQQRIFICFKSRSGALCDRRQVFTNEF